MKLNRYKDFIIFNEEKYKVLFSTAENNRNFNRHTEDGVKTLQELKEEFNVDDVIYLRQIHSDIIYKYTGDNKKGFIENEGDAIITNVKNTAIGVFTADCVPVILVDTKKNVIAAIHSGWKGTFSSITAKTIDRLKEEYEVNPKDLKAYIGPHIRQCCYEVSNELKEKFIKEKDICEDKLFSGRNLSMEQCIIKDLNDKGVKSQNIILLGLCTYCRKDIKLYSYRRSNGDYGRLFSFIILK